MAMNVPKKSGPVWRQTEGRVTPSLSRELSRMELTTHAEHNLKIASGNPYSPTHTGLAVYRPLYSAERIVHLAPHRTS